MVRNSRRRNTLTILTTSLDSAAPVAGRKYVMGLLSVWLLVPAAGCMAMGLAPMAAMSSSEQHGAAAPAGPAPDMCPVHVPGTLVEVVDTQEYVALLFVTRGGDVADLRNRVRYLAEIPGQASASSPGGGHQAMQHGMMGCMMMSHEGGHGSSNAEQPLEMAAWATVEDIPDGARLTLVPVAPTSLEALRSLVHQDAQTMQHGECPQMSMGGQPGAVPGQTASDGHHH
jgi:hypothetical protein